MQKRREELARIEKDKQAEVRSYKGLMVSEKMTSNKELASKGKSLQEMEDDFMWQEICLKKVSLRMCSHGIMSGLFSGKLKEPFYNTKAEKKSGAAFLAQLECACLVWCIPYYLGEVKDCKWV